MTICHITSMHDWDDDRIYQRACIGLSNNGMKVCLIATDTPDKAENDISFYRLKRRKGIQRRILSSRQAYLMAKKINSDIYHFHDPDLLPWMVILSLLGKKVIYDVHENYNERILSSNLIFPLKFLLSKAWRSLEWFSCYFFAGIITTTDSMQMLFPVGKIPKLSVSNTPYLKVLENMPLENEKIPYSIYTSGTNSNKRNCLQTIDAFPKVLKKYPDAKMIFVGRYEPAEFKEVLRQKVTDLNIEDSVILEGMLPWKENFKRSSKMEIGCVFYEENANNRVTIPNRLFEYMYSGLAIIGESFPEIEKVVNSSKSGVCLNSSNPDEISNGIIGLFQDEEGLRQMQKNAQEAVYERYAYEHELIRMMDFYKSIYE